MGEVMQRLMGSLKPEAAYFHPVNGNRGMTLVVDAPDGASLPSLAGPRCSRGRWPPSTGMGGLSSQGQAAPLME